LAPPCSSPPRNIKALYARVLMGACARLNVVQLLLLLQGATPSRQVAESRGQRACILLAVTKHIRGGIKAPVSAETTTDGRRSTGGMWCIAY
jgi:hypothetical protein